MTALTLITAGYNASVQGAMPKMPRRQAIKKPAIKLPTSKRHGSVVSLNIPKKLFEIPACDIPVAS
jgi:hypothetical protein